MSSSDTEPESEGSIPLCQATDFATQGNIFKENLKDGQDYTLLATIAVQNLMFIDLKLIEIDPTLHENIAVAHNNLSLFLDNILALDKEFENHIHEVLGTLASILNSTFMSLLFQYRQIFHRIAFRALPPGAAVPVSICWVDMLLVQLRKVTIFVAGGFNFDMDPLEQLVSLRLQLEEDHLRTAAQLPHIWEAAQAVFASQDASPAARRLSLTLNFASHVVAPHLGVDATSEHSRLPPGEMLQLLQVYFQELSLLTATDRTDISSKRDRFVYAMAICLFVVTNRQIHEVNPLHSFQPLTLATVLSCIRVVMDHHDMATAHVLIPIKSLDPSQFILIRWGGVVPACWKLWKDQRIAYVETITFLTVNWLYYLEADEYRLDSGEHMSSWEEYLEICLSKDFDASSIVFLEILQHSLKFLALKQTDIPEMFWNVMCKSYWAISRIAGKTLTHGWTNPFERLMCEYLCCAWILTGDTYHGLSVKTFIVEGLSYIVTSIFRSVLDHLVKNNTYFFVTKLEQALVHRKRKLLSQDRTTHDVTATRGILLFLTTLWYNGSEGGVHHHTLSCFLVPLVDFISNLCEDCSQPDCLLETLLTALAALERCRASNDAGKFRLWDYETIWQLAVNSPSDLMVACAFANLILATPQDRLCDALSCAEAWSYLRDVALLIMAHHFMNDEEPLAMVVSPIIFNGLLSLLRRTNPNGVRFILSSPWTINLCADLRNLIDGRQSRYSEVLRERTSVECMAILEEISRKMESHSDVDCGALVESRVRLMHIQKDNIPRLVLVPEPADS